MAMVVKNNLSAKNTLNQLDKNEKAKNKNLKNLSSGLKINSAGDDASGLSISERMEVQIRSLDQDNQNSQNGVSMLKTAEGAVSSTVDILRTLKEKAINAANDTNTDADRATMQKEFDQAIEQIDENAHQTYNGQTLIDGSKEHYVPDPGTRTSLTNETLYSDTNDMTFLTDLKVSEGNSLLIDSTDTMTVSYVMDGKTYTSSIKVGTTDLGSIFPNAFPDKTDQDVALRYPVDNTVGENEFGETVMNPSGKVALTFQSRIEGVDHQIAGLTITFQDKYGTAKDKANALFEHLSTTVCAKDPSEDHSISINKSGKEMKVSFSDLTSRGLGFGSLNTPKSFFPTMPDYASQKISEDLRSVKAQNANGETKTLDVTNFTYLNLYDKINNEHLVFDNMLFLNASNQSFAVTAGDIIAKMLVIKAIKEKHYMKANASMIDSAIKKCDMALEDNDRYCKEYYAL